jgi:hypothetical protein
MKRQITQISVHQSSKVLGVFHFLLSALICMPLAVLAFLLTRKLEYLALVLIPFAYWLLTYGASAMLAWTYNIAAKNFGGVEYNTAEVEHE